MKIEVRTPNKYLSEFVKCFWILEKGNSFHIERLFPSGELQFIFHYGTPFREENAGAGKIIQPEFSCCGQFTKFKNIISESAAGLFGVVFHPYAVTSFLNIPAGELSETTVDLEFLSRDFRSLGGRIQEALSTEERINIIEHYLMKKLAVPNLFHFNIVKDTIDEMSNSSGHIRIEKLAGKYSIGERQFERVFNNYVGLSPRKFSNIIRFRKSLKLMESSSSLTEISYLSGYYDQPQFNRSFMEYTGYTPGEYRNLIGK